MSTQRERDRRYKSGIGLLVIVSLVAILIILRLYQQTAGPLSETLPLHITLPSADGVVADTPVKLAGLKIGRVTGVTLQDDNLVRIDLAIETAFAGRVREDSRAFVHRPIIGGAYINIGIGSDARPRLNAGQQIEALLVPDLNDMVASLPSRLEAIDEVLENARSLTADLRRSTRELTAQDGMIDRTFKQIDSATARVSEAARRLNLILDDVREVVAESAKSIEATNATLEQAAALVDDLRPLGPKAADMAASLDRTLENIEVLSQELRDLSPHISSVVISGQDAIDEANEVMRAAKQSILLRGNPPPPAATPMVPAPRP